MAFWKVQSAPFFNMPEVEHLSRIERDQLYMKLFERRKSHNERTDRAVRKFHWLYVICNAVIWLSLLATPWLRSAWIAVSLIAFAFGLMGVRAWLGRHLTRLLLQELLLDEGIRPACCFRCGYDLRVAASPTCPECGENLVTNAKYPSVDETSDPH